MVERVKISNFLGLSFPKGKLIEPESFTGVSCPGTEGLWKVWDKTECRFLIQSPKNLQKFLSSGQEGQTFKLCGLFFLKGILVESETLTGVSCSGTGGLWRAWGKTELWFPIQPPKNLEIFFRAGRKVKISNFIGSFFLKGKLIEPGNSQEFPVLALKDYGEVGAKLNRASQFSLVRTCEFLSSR